MNSLSLKIIAVVAMLADHIGFVFGRQLPEYATALRLFGRLAFPIFCFLIAEGYVKTSNVHKYALRLLTLAVLSEIPFDMMSGVHSDVPVFINYNAQNVFFTLLLGLIAIWAIDVNTKLHKAWFGWSLAVLCMVTASFIRADYGLFGVAFMIVFFVGRGNHSRVILGILGVLAVRYTFVMMGIDISEMLILRPFIEPPSERVVTWAIHNLFAGMALPLIFMCNGKKGYNSKFIQWSFYAFYPVHMVVLYAMHLMVVA